MKTNFVLSTRSIEKHFYKPKPFKVLKGISFDVERGEFLSIMGKSGCGKTTLLYVLSTMDTDYDGDLTILGRNLRGCTKNELASFRNEHIGFVFQFHYLLPEFTALDNVMLPAMKLGKKPNEEIRDSALVLLDTVGIKRLADKKASMLSGGEQQRVAVARALINEPILIMGDEPTGNLDSRNTQILFDTLRELSRSRGQTIVTVTHDDEFAANCDRVLEMSDGMIIDSITCNS